MIGQILAWLVTTEGQRAVVYVAGAIAAAFAGKKTIDKGKTRRYVDAVALAAQIFDAVETAHRTGKLASSIAVLGGNVSMAKWTRGVTLFAEGWRARGYKEPTTEDLDVFRTYVERQAMLTSPHAGQ